MRLRILIPTLLAGGIPATVQAAEIVKANNAFALNLDDSWVNEQRPGVADIAVFDGTLTSPSPKPVLGESMSWAGIRATNTLTQEATLGYTAGAVLSIGAAGISMESTIASRGINIGSNFAAAANQTWSTVLLAASPASPGIAFNIQGSMNLGGYTVTRNGEGRMSLNAFGSSAPIFSNGSLLLDSGITEFRSGTGSSQVTDSFNVRINPGATFTTTRGSALLDTFKWNGNLQLNGGTLKLGETANALTIGGTINATAPSTILHAFGTGTTAVAHVITAPISGSANLSLQNTSANPNHRIQLSGDNSSYSGTLSIDGSSGARTVKLASDASGSQLATWHIAAGNTLEIGANVTLGLVTGSGSLKVAGSTLTLNGANPFVGTTSLTDAYLAGTGSLAGNVVASGGSVISPGNSPGAFGIGGSLDLQIGSAYLAEISGMGVMDRLSMVSASPADLTFNGALEVGLRNGFIPAWNDSFKLMDWSAGYTVSGSPTFRLPALSPGLEWNTDAFLTNGTISVIPEPNTVLLCLLGLPLILCRRKAR
jgi:hypothetical protein